MECHASCLPCRSMVELRHRTEPAGCTVRTIYSCLRAPMQAVVLEAAAMETVAVA